MWRAHLERPTVRNRLCTAGHWPRAGETMGELWGLAGLWSLHLGSKTCWGDTGGPGQPHTPLSMQRDTQTWLVLKTFIIASAWACSSHGLARVCVCVWHCGAAAELSQDWVAEGAPASL